MKKLENETLLKLLIESISKNKVLSQILEVDGVYLCGGYIRDNLSNLANTLSEEARFITPKDADFFFRDQKALDEVLGILDVAQDIYVTDVLHPDSDVPIQLVHKEFFEDKESIINSFDFTTSMALFDGKDIYLGDTTFVDICMQQCNVNVITKPLSSLNRLVRFKQIGYNVTSSYNYIVSLLASKGDACLGVEYYEGD